MEQAALRRAETNQRRQACASPATMAAAARAWATGNQRRFYPTPKASTRRQPATGRQAAPRQRRAPNKRRKRQDAASTTGGRGGAGGARLPGGTGARGGARLRRAPPSERLPPMKATASGRRWTRKPASSTGIPDRRTGLPSINYRGAAASVKKVRPGKAKKRAKPPRSGAPTSPSRSAARSRPRASDDCLTAFKDIGRATLS